MAKKPSKKDEKPAETPEAAPAENGAAVAGDAAPQLRVLAQYIKDASFENPNAPDSSRTDLPPPGIDLNVEVRATPRDENTAEVGLLVTARAMRGEEVAFICELEYAGLFAFANIPVEQMKPIMLIECPRILFPFARRIVADMTQNGNFPPLMLDPIDFAALYAQQGGGQSREMVN